MLHLTFKHLFVLRAAKQINLLFLVSTTFLLSLYVFLLPSLTTRAEVYAETGTNFYLVARYGTLWENIITTDYGYLPWLQRTIAYGAVRLFGFKQYYPYAVQWVALIFVASACSLINLQDFRKIVPSDLVRFLLGIHIGLFPDYELFTFVNFAYFGVVVALYAMFRVGEPASKNGALIAMYLLPLILPSKPYFIVLLPILGGMTIYFLWKKVLRRFWYSLLMVVMLLLQVGSLVMHSSTVPGHPQKHLNIVELIGATVHLYFDSLGASFFLNGYFETSLFWVRAASCLILLLTFYFVWHLVKTKSYKRASAILFLHYMTLGACALTSTMSASNVDWSVLAPFRYFRWYFFSYVGIVLGLAILSGTNRKVTSWIMMLWLLVANYSFFERLKDIYPHPFDSYSQWVKLSEVLDAQSYCMPVNPYPWLVRKDCDYLAPLPDLDAQSKVNAVILVRNKGGSKTKVQQIAGLDNEDEVLGVAKLLSAPESRYLYYYFDAPIVGVQALQFFDKKHQKRPTPPAANVVLLGSR